MKNLFLILFALMLSTSMQAQQKAKRFAVKSGKIVMELSGSTTGTKTIYFDNYGDKYYEEEKSVTITKMFGITDKEETHKIMITNKGKFWTIDKIDGDNYQGSLPFYNESHEMVDGMSEAQQKKLADDVLASMGGQKLGQEKVLGYNCDKISVMGAKSWIYKGIVLRSEASIMGIVSNEIASEFEENISIPSSKFKAPTGNSFEDIDAQQQAAFGSFDMSMSMEEEEDSGDDDIVAVTYPFDKFQKAMNSFNPEGYTKTMVMQQDGQHIALFMQGFGSVLSVMATSDENLVEEEEDFAQFESFKHGGKTMHFGNLTADGVVGKALIIPFEEHDMYILLLAAPAKSKEVMLDMADKLDF